MANVVVVGAQWGDEGKGKIVDWLSEQADIVVRFQGGHNAGHTLVINGETYKLALLPSGVLRPSKLSVIGNGVVVDPRAFLDEVSKLKSQGVTVSPDNLRVAENVTLILPLHRELDALRESSNAITAIGTTRRGIGPCYADKAARLGIRVQDLLDEKILKKKIVAAMEPKRLSLREFARDPRLDLQAMTEEYLTYGHRIKQYIADTSRLVRERQPIGVRPLWSAR